MTRHPTILATPTAAILRDAHGIAQQIERGPCAYRLTRPYARQIAGALAIAGAQVTLDSDRGLAHVAAGGHRGGRR